MHDKALVATRKGLFELDRTTAGWEIGRASFVGDPVSMILSDPRDGTQYAALNLGHFGIKLHRRRANSDTGADAWAEIAAPAFPPQPESAADDVAWKVTLIWSLAAGGQDQPGVLWAGTIPGALFRSRDHGDSWELISSLWDTPERREWQGGGYDQPGIHSICVDPRDSNRVLVAVSTGGAWLTSDGGATWTISAAGMHAEYMPPELADNQNVQDAHQVVQCAAAPEVLWCQHHNGIWRSGNGGALWERVRTPAPLPDFGFAVAVHPTDPDTAWFVPAIADQKRIPLDAAMAVSRTRDGGKSFEALRVGLPQRHCYDLVYRHGLAVAADGTTLLMGSTTGGLWITSDAGDTWRELALTLPPVYAVRFVSA
jgi:photosystem II stability/assembly factor-like uncharacterized protein